MKKAALIYVVPLGLAVVFAILVAWGVLVGLESRVYDAFLRWRANPHQSDKIVLVEVDDQAVSEVGTWPISRSITAHGLLLLKEMGARYAVFDIEYLNKSPRGVDPAVLEETFPSQLSESIGGMVENNARLVEALRTKQFPLSEASSLAESFEQASEEARDGLLQTLSTIAIDNDKTLARAIEIFDNVILTVNIQREIDSTVTSEQRETAVRLFGLSKPSGLAFLKDHQEIIPVIEPLLSSAKRLGFTNVSLDASDGVRRRIELVKRYGDHAFPQLAFAPYLDLMGNPNVEITPDAIWVKGARWSEEAFDLRIPRAQDGSVLINWPHTTFANSFRHLSFYYLYQHDKLWDDLVHNLKARASWGYLDLYQGEQALLDQALGIHQLRADLLAGEAPPEAISDLRVARDQFLRALGEYFESNPDQSLLTQLDEALADPRLTEQQRQDYQTIRQDLPQWFTQTRGVLQPLVKYRSDPKGLASLDGALCFLGNTNTGSTDLGVNPFESGYPNLGTHASVMNMLLQRDFITDASPWWSWAIGVLGALALTFFLRDKKPVFALSVGTVLSVAILAGSAVGFALTSFYIPVIPVAGLMIFTFLGTTFFQFLNTEKEKGFLRSAFSRYLSNDVIEQIIANPGQLKLGGQEKVLTAVFTDIRGFSTISEKMTPEELVFLLNQYLTGMSDIILDLQGTIDKYEGDAIIAFFGAPVSFDDHARRACLAAVRMKRLEDQLNARFLEEKIAPAPLATRIGINTGPMVVGNMGTDRMMNYTMIGDAVNLAARLEGVNKLYGTWILISEDTMKAAGDVVVTRKLDRVRVVGKSVPIRLFQAVEEKGKLPEGVATLLSRYHEALDHFEARRWSAAKAGFDECLKLFPDDGPSVRYRKLAADYETTPPPENWDGVFKMDQK